MTVIFLPISFGTSLYSMNGPPSQQTVVHMIIAAIVALLVTTIALINANLLDKALRPIFSGTRRIFESIINPITKLVYGTLIGQGFYFLARCLLVPLFDILQSSGFPLPTTLNRFVIKARKYIKKRQEKIEHARSHQAQVVSRA